MNLPTKEQWLSFDKQQKQNAISEALFLLDFLYTNAHRIYKHSRAEGEIPRNKQIIKEFLRDVKAWEIELDKLSKNEDPTIPTSD